MQILQRDHIDLAHELRCAIVALHQLLARTLLAVVGESELRGKRILLIEDEPVLAAASEIVEPDAQCADHAFLPRHHACFAHRDEARMRKLTPGTAEARSA